MQEITHSYHTSEAPSPEIWAQLSAVADSGQSQFSGLSRDVKGLRRDVNAVSGLASYKGECTADASGPSGVAVYVLPCRR